LGVRERRSALLIQAIAEAALFAYLRPVLLELKRRTPRERAILDILHFGSWIFSLS
jgi:hypothetical protein